jgi:hypothetical protein
MSGEITAAQKTALLKLPGFKDIQKQYAKEQKMAGSGKRRMKGRGSFWNDVYNFFVDAGTTVNDFLKKTKLISNVAGAVLPLLAPMGTALLTANPLAAAASVGAAKAAAEGIKSLGYGSNVVMSKMNGKGIFPLAINPAGQRMRGVNPKSKMRGGDPVDTLASGISYLGKSIGSLAKNSAVIKNLKKQKGGYSSEDAMYIARAITGRGGYGTTNNTVGVNGLPQKVSVPAHSGMIGNLKGKGKGKPAKMTGMGGTEYGSISSEFGNVQF